MMHRYLALAVVLASGGLISVIKRLGPKPLRRAALLLHLLLWGQAGLGVLTLYSFSDYPGYYELLSVAHLAWGTLVWASAVSLLLGLKGVRGGAANPRDFAAFGAKPAAKALEEVAQTSRQRAKARKTPKRGRKRR